MKFAYLYALPGYKTPEIQVVSTESATFYSVAVDFNHREQVADVAKQLVAQEQVNMIELCGGLATAELIAAVKEAVNYEIPVGAVFYGPEFRQTLADLTKKK